MVLWIFKIVLRLKDRHVFMSQSLEILNVFNTLTLKPIFSKTKIFFKKLKYPSSVESTRIEHALFPYETVLSETNVKINRMESTRWAYKKQRSFTSNYFTFSEILFQFKNLVKRVGLTYHGTIIRTGMTCKKIRWYVRATQLADGLLLKMLKYFEVIWKIFEFSHVKETLKFWLVYVNKFSWIIQSCFLTETIKQS